MMGQLALMFHFPKFDFFKAAFPHPMLGLRAIVILQHGTDEQHMQIHALDKLCFRIWTVWRNPVPLQCFWEKYHCHAHVLSLPYLVSVFAGVAYVYCCTDGKQQEFLCLTRYFDSTNQTMPSPLARILSRYDSRFLVNSSVFHVFAWEFPVGLHADNSLSSGFCRPHPNSSVSLFWVSPVLSGLGKGRLPCTLQSSCSCLVVPEGLASIYPWPVVILALCKCNTQTAFVSPSGPRTKSGGEQNLQ